MTRIVSQQTEPPLTHYLVFIYYQSKILSPHHAYAIVQGGRHIYQCDVLVIKQQHASCPPYPA